jgi:hypothetical protein
MPNPGPMFNKPPALVCCLCLALMAAMVPALQASLTMRIDTENNFFYMEGSDTGNGFDFGFGSFDLQFYHRFAIQPSQSASITTTPQNLFVQGTTLPISGGNMNMIRGTPSYVFIDLSADSDITALTGRGPSEIVSYASLPALDQALFESMIGQTFELTIGSGYSDIAVEAVPEPSTYALLALAAAGIGAQLWRRRRK